MFRKNIYHLRILLSQITCREKIKTDPRIRYGVRRNSATITNRRTERANTPRVLFKPINWKLILARLHPPYFSRNSSTLFNIARFYRWRVFGLDKYANNCVWPNSGRFPSHRFQWLSQGTSAPSVHTPYPTPIAANFYETFRGVVERPKIKDAYSFLAAVTEFRGMKSPYRVAPISSGKLLRTQGNFPNDFVAFHVG